MPIVTVEATRGWKALRLRELVDSRELLYFLAWRDVKVRYRQSVLGVLWVLLQPLLLMAVLYVLFARIAVVDSEGHPYWLFAVTALVPWTMFSTSVPDATMSLVASSNLVSKVYFPRLLIPMASVESHVVDLLIALDALLVVIFVGGPGLTSRIILVPLLVIFVVMVTMAVGIFLAALNVRYRDVRYVVPFAVQLLLFVSPVAYSTAEIGSSARALYAVNPLAGVIEGFRWALLNNPRDPTVMVLVSGVTTLVLLFAALVYFRRVERTFADVI